MCLVISFERSLKISAHFVLGSSHEINGETLAVALTLKIVNSLASLRNHRLCHTYNGFLAIRKIIYNSWLKLLSIIRKMQENQAIFQLNKFHLILN